jgi:hypothetical protein
LCLRGNYYSKTTTININIKAKGVEITYYDTLY